MILEHTIKVKFGLRCDWQDIKGQCRNTIIMAPITVGPDDSSAEADLWIKDEALSKGWSLWFDGTGYQYMCKDHGFIRNVKVS